MVALERTVRFIGCEEAEADIASHIKEGWTLDGRASIVLYGTSVYHTMVYARPSTDGHHDEEIDARLAARETGARCMGYECAGAIPRRNRSWGKGAILAARPAEADVMSYECAGRISRRKESGLATPWVEIAQGFGICITLLAACSVAVSGMFLLARWLIG